MLSGFFAALCSQSAEKKAFIAVIAAALFVRVFVLFTMPDAPLTDTLYHLTIIRYIIQNNAIPFLGIVGHGVHDMPTPLYHIIAAITFRLLPIQFNLATARIFPFIFSFLQLFLSFLILKRLFPEHWVYGFAFVAVHPILLIFGAVNYTGTLASVSILLCFFIYQRFSESGKTIYLLVMPFALAAAAISKESATILLPAFFLAFLFALWRKRPTPVSKQWAAKAAFLVLASLLLSSAWFIANYNATGSLSSSITAGQGKLEEVLAKPISWEGIAFYALRFNSSFWFLLDKGLEFLPFPPAASFALFSLITFPVLALLFYGIGKGLEKRQGHAALLLLCFGLTLFILIAKGGSFIYSRFLIPLLPILGVAFCTAFQHLKNTPWRKLLTALFLLTAIYSLCLSSLYAMHFQRDYSSHVPLYDFMKDLPPESKIAIHTNKARQVKFIAGRESFQYNSSFKGMAAGQLHSVLDGNAVTHIAATCYQNPWDMQVLEEMVSQQAAEEIYRDSCSTLYALR